MKKNKMVLGLSLIAISGLILVAADHVDAPSVTGNAADITDLYTFQGQETNNLVLRLTLVVKSKCNRCSAAFNENVMIEINIDNTGDNVEDLVIQAIKRMIRCISSDHMLPEQLEHLVQLKPVLLQEVLLF
jgi:hypothetical protein